MFRKIKDSIFQNSLYQKNLTSILEFTYDPPPNLGEGIIFTKSHHGEKNKFAITIDIAQQGNSGFHIGMLELKNDGKIIAKLYQDRDQVHEIASKNFNEIIENLAKELPFEFTYIKQLRDKKLQEVQSKEGDIVKAALSGVNPPPPKDVANLIAKYLSPEDIVKLSDVNQAARGVTKGSKK